MKRYFGYSLVAIAVMLLQGCFGAGGNSVPAPAGVDVVAKDSRVVVTWNMSPGVEYWIYKAAGVGVTPKNCSVMPLCTTSVKVTSPATIWLPYNDLQYSFSINGRTNGGPGGPGSTAVSKTPGLAGKVWDKGPDFASTPNMHSVAYGAVGAKYVAAGDGGALFSSTDGLTWTSMPNTLTNNLNAVNYAAALSKFYSVGDSGTVLVHTPSVSSTAWVPQTIAGVTDALYGVANNGGSLVVATGANGRIVYSNNGTDWNTNTTFSQTVTQTFYGVTYGYTIAHGNMFIAVGAAGTIFWSQDGIAWTQAISNTPENLKSVTYGGYDSNASAVFVAVGTTGTVLTSEDGTTWTKQTFSSSTSSLNAVTYLGGKRFVAVADDGNVFYSSYLIPSTGMVWDVAPQVTTLPLYAVTTNGLYDYSAVGKNGLNFHADRSDY